MKGDNRNWGARTIAYELQKKLGVPISRETVRKIEILYRENGDIPPEGLWKYFQVAVWQSLYACDFIYKRIKSKTYFVFFIIQLHTRKIVQCGVTEHPNTAFLRNQLSVFSDHYPDSYLIHDNSPELKYFPYKEYHIKGINIVPYSPNMNAYAERFVRTLREGCLNYCNRFIFGCAHLYGIINTYLDYYNNFRIHQGIMDIPSGLPKECAKTGIIKKKSMVFGLHNHYYRQAA